MKTKQKFIFGSIVAIIIILFLPVKIGCGAPGNTCTSAPDNGVVSRYYEVEPVGIFLVESLVNKDVPIHYTDGYDYSAL